VFLCESYFWVHKSITQNSSHFSRIVLTISNYSTEVSGVNTLILEGYTYDVQYDFAIRKILRFFFIMPAKKSLTATMHQYPTAFSAMSSQVILRYQSLTSTQTSSSCKEQITGILSFFFIVSASLEEEIREMHNIWILIYSLSTWETRYCASLECSSSRACRNYKEETQDTRLFAPYRMKMFG